MPMYFHHCCIYNRDQSSLFLSRGDTHAERISSFASEDIKIQTLSVLNCQVRILIPVISFYFLNFITFIFSMLELFRTSFFLLYWVKIENIAEKKLKITGKWKKKISLSPFVSRFLRRCTGLHLNFHQASNIYIFYFKCKKCKLNLCNLTTSATRNNLSSFVFVVLSMSCYCRIS